MDGNTKLHNIEHTNTHTLTQTRTRTRAHTYTANTLMSRSLVVKKHLRIRNY